MHPCLRIDEIVLNIAEKADEIPRDFSSAGSPSSISSGESDSYGSATLRRDPVLSLALVCKSFHLQAIRVIWKELKTGVSPLFECFSDDAWVSDPRSGSRYLKFLTWEEWENFMLHSFRVRKIILDWSEMDFPEQELNSLSIHRPLLDLFPGLRALEWVGDSDGERIMYSYLFVSPSLLSLTIKDVIAAAVLDFVKALSMTAPFLSSLHIGRHTHHYYRSDSLYNTISRFVPSFPCLAELTCDMVFSFAALKDLAYLPRLVKLHGNIDSSQSGEWSPDALYMSFFPSLQYLRLYLDNTSSSLLEFLEELANAPAVRQLCLMVKQTSHHTDISSLLRVMGKFTALRDLSVSMRLTHSELPNNSVPVTVLVPLISLRLKSLDMAETPFLLDDDAIEMIGESFPDLTLLRLGNTAKFPSLHSNWITHNGLRSLASHCKCLQTLGLPIDLNGVIHLDLLQPSPPPSLHLQRIEVRSVIADDPTIIAAVVSASFPHASFFPSKLPDGGSVPLAVTRSWDEVNGQKNVFRLVRQQMRAQ